MEQSPASVRKEPPSVFKGFGKNSGEQVTEDTPTKDFTTQYGTQTAGQYGTQTAGQYGTQATSSTPASHSKVQEQRRSGRDRTEPSIPELRISTASPNIPLFGGGIGQDARRWMGRFEREVHRGNDALTCADWLEEFNCALEGEAAEWADTDYQVSNLLTDDSIASATTQTMESVRKAFLDRFKRTVMEKRNPIPDIQELKQLPEESVRQYYHRALTLLHMAGGEDEPNHASAAIKSLMQLTKERFIAGLRDTKLRILLLRHPNSTSAQTLAGALADAEACHRQIQAEARMEEEIRKEAELALYRQMASDIMNNGSCSQQVINQLRTYGEPFSSTSLVGEQPTVPSTQASAPHSYEGGRPEGQSNNTPQRRVAFQDPPLGPARQQTSGQNGPYRGPESRSASPYGRGQQPATGNTGTDRAQVEGEARQRAIAAIKAKYPQFDAATSTNVYVNGERKHRHTRDNPLCYTCGIPGHVATSCSRESTLSAVDRQFLFELGQAEAQLWREARDGKAPANYPNVGSIGVDLLEDSMRCFTIDDDNVSEDEDFTWEDVPIDREAPLEVEVLAGPTTRNSSKRPREGTSSENAQDSPVTGRPNRRPGKRTHTSTIPEDEAVQNSGTQRTTQTANGDAQGPAPHPSSRRRILARPTAIPSRSGSVLSGDRRNH